jgi:hypothetical protein
VHAALTDPDADSVALRELLASPGWAVLLRYARKEWAADAILQSLVVATSKDDVSLEQLGTLAQRAVATVTVASRFKDAPALLLKQIDDARADQARERPVVERRA